MKILQSIAVVLALAALSHAAVAQRVSGSVLRDENGAPIAGAIISTFAGRDTTPATLTRTDGTFLVTLPRRGSRTLLVRAIGLRPVQVPLSGARDTVLEVRMIRIAQLAAVKVLDINVCEQSSTGTSDIADIWQEVTTALENTRIVRNSEKRRFYYQLYELQTDFGTGRQRTLKDETSSWVATRPFRVAAPSSLARQGYVVEERRGFGARPQLLYRAPDEMVLLDDSFQRTHCFWSAEGSGNNRDLVGVHFMPLSGIRINDIRGVFWIDAVTYELRRLDFIYTQIEPRRPRGSADSSATPESMAVSRRVTPSLRNPVPGGTLEFTRLPDGSFIIPSWRLYVNDTWTRLVTPGEPLREPGTGKETGGLVLRIEPVK
jgi:hypothetical protein